jgi:DNA-binding transcriptional LysR family regulator
VRQAFFAIEIRDDTSLDRSSRYPKLTPEGVLLLADARNIISGVDTLKARARLMSSGLEAELSVVVDVFFPTAVFSVAAKAFASRFPLTPLRVFVEGLGAAYEPVVDGRCSLGVLAPLSREFPSLVSESVGPLSLVTVAAPSHPLASFERRIPKAALAKHVQLMLTDRSDLSAGRPWGAGGDDLALGKPLHQACIPARRRWLGQHAAAHGER